MHARLASTTGSARSNRAKKPTSSCLIQARLRRSRIEWRRPAAISRSNSLHSSRSGTIGRCARPMSRASRARAEPAFEIVDWFAEVFGLQGDWPAVRAPAIHALGKMPYVLAPDRPRFIERIARPSARLTDQDDRLSFRQIRGIV